jgi:hypothetical protein
MDYYRGSLNSISTGRNLVPVTLLILDREDALIEPEASLLQEAIEALIVALYNTPDDEESNDKVKPQVIKLDKALDALERLKLYKGQ